VLDQNFQVSWVWNSFKWLNTNRIGPDHGVPSDWLHANSVSWSPEDDDLIVSLRAQDWVIKIDYAGGTGNGHIIWKLGNGGNFKAIANTPQPWFSHQHDARMINDNTLLVFDDGNTRQEFDPTADSRGQEWIINEQNMTATLVVNADMGNYSDFLGSSELLPNGNLAFTSGGLLLDGEPAGQSIEVLPNGTRVYSQQMSIYEYRSYFESTLYSAGLINE
jgi:arylsulfate sulfotransferase